MGGSGSTYVPSMPSSPCGNLVFNAVINSPQPSVVGRLTIGESLLLALGPGSQSVIVLHNGDVAGSLTGTQVAQLINCLNSGFIYHAIVVSLNGGKCVVRVESV